jgi:hypothetical protein
VTAGSTVRHRERPRSLSPIILGVDRDTAKDCALPAKSVRRPATVQP